MKTGKNTHKKRKDNMNNKQIWKYAILNSLGTAVYVGLVATFLSNANRWLGPGPDNQFLAIISMLLLLVLSVSVVGGLLLVRPLIWFLNGSKQEAIKLFIYSLISLFILTAAAFTVIALLPKPQLIY